MASLLRMAIVDAVLSLSAQGWASWPNDNEPVRIWFESVQYGAVGGPFEVPRPRQVSFEKSQ